MAGYLLVINPNATVEVTRSIDRAMDAFRVDGEREIKVIGLSEGPKGIENQEHVELVVPLILSAIRRHPDASGYVISCFSDPGLYAAREIAVKPVFGIAECGILTALTLGARFGLISILPKVIPRHMRVVGAMGLMSRLAGDRAIGRGITQLADDDATFIRMRDVGIELRDNDGADVIVMACAGMANYRARLAEVLAIPVVEPSQAAVSMALGRLRLGW